MEYTPSSASSQTATDWPYPPRRTWLAILAIALGSFALIITELLPIALLSSVATDLRVTEGTAGLLVALPAIVAAVTALTMALTDGRTDRRTLLVAFTVLMLLSNLLSLFAPTFTVMLLARVLIGVALGGFWSIAASLAPRLVRPAAVGSATATILSGVSIGTLIAVPAGTFIGIQMGWRAAFLLTAVLAAAALLLQLVLVPHLPARASAGLQALPELLARLQMRVLLGAVLLVFMGHLGAYTYINPFLQAQLLSPTLITTVLLIYGVSGIFGNFLAGARAAQHPHYPYPSRGLRPVDIGSPSVASRPLDSGARPGGLGFRIRRDSRIFPKLGVSGCPRRPRNRLRHSGGRATGGDRFGSGHGRAARRCGRPARRVVVRRRPCGRWLYAGKRLGVGVDDRPLARLKPG